MDSLKTLYLALLGLISALGRQYVLAARVSRLQNETSIGRLAWVLLGAGVSFLR